MAKINWEKRNQQSLIRKKGYEDFSCAISPYKQCTEKQYQLIEKLILKLPANKKLVKQFLFCDLNTDKLLPREELTKTFAIILIDKILKKPKTKRNKK